MNCPKKMNGACKGCIEADGYVPEWSASGRCKVHACAREHDVQFCGLCDEFPCKDLTTKIHWNPNIVQQLTHLAEEYKKNFTIELMQPADWEQVRQIYLEGIQTQLATFQTEAPTWEDWNNGHLACCRYVARLGDKILGWVALSPTSSRPCYSGVTEVSIYIGKQYKHQSIGTKLLKQVIEASENNDIWSLYCAIIKENQASVALHKKCGFRIIGTRERIAKMADGTWHDVVLMERRSQTIGLD